MRLFCFLFFACLLLSGQYDFKKLDDRMQQFVDDGELVGIQISVIKDEKCTDHEAFISNTILEELNLLKSR